MMTRRGFLTRMAGASLFALTGMDARAAVPSKDWLALWQAHVLGEVHHRYCDTTTGEDCAWLLSPFLNAFYYGWLATGDRQWIGIFIDWTDSWIRRAVTEPDGFRGWPATGAAGTGVDDLNSFYADSLVADAMVLRPVVLMSKTILSDPKLKKDYGAKAKSCLKLSGRIFEKWEERGAWREISGDKGIWVVLPFGIDRSTGQWTVKYKHRKEANIGFSVPNNKANEIALWHLAMHDATGKRIYQERAERWFRLMRSRMTTRDNGRYFVWNYWEPAGTWDKKPDGSTKHWVGVHPNGGYYNMDVEAITAASEHGLVFTKEDIDRLIATNRDFMWNHEMTGAKFQRIDGGPVDDRWKNTPGLLWSSLVPYDKTLTDIFLANNDPSTWLGLIATPRYLAWQRAGRRVSPAPFLNP